MDGDSQALAGDLEMALDPVRFAKHLGFEPDAWQAGVLRWGGKRLALNCGRQTGKSTTAAALALHRAVYYPGSLILLVSPSQRQSTELFRKVGELLGRVEADGKPELTEDNRLSCVLANLSRIVSLPSSEATIRGFSGASLIVEDEASRVSDDLYRAVRPMLATSGGRLVLMSTPYGKRGHFWEVWNEGGPEWERVKVPATECPRIGAAFLAEEQRSLGAWWFSQEYLCEFIDAASSAFTWEMVQAAQKEQIESWNL